MERRIDGAHATERRSTRRLVLLAVVLALVATACARGATTSRDDGPPTGVLLDQFFTYTDEPLRIAEGTLLANDERKPDFPQQFDANDYTFGLLFNVPETTGDGSCTATNVCTIGDIPVLGCGEVCTTPNGGTVQKECTDTCRVLYTPKRGFTGLDTFRYKVCQKYKEDNGGDGGEHCGVAVATVGVGPGTLKPKDDPTPWTPAPGCPPRVQRCPQPPPPWSPKADGTFSVTLAHLLGNDRIWIMGYDTAVAIKPAPGTVTVTQQAEQGGTVVYDAATTTFTYTPPAKVTTTTDSFTYRYCDQRRADMCGSGRVTVQLTVTPPTTTSTTRPPEASAPADTDGDGVANSTDNCVNVANPTQLNTDGANDGGDACDTDDDNDTVLDGTDNCPVTANAAQTNTDGAADGGNACDTDDDNDGRPDSTDAFPLDNGEQDDADADGFGDNMDDPCTADATNACARGQLTAAGNSWTVNASPIAYGPTTDRVDLRVINNDGISHDFWIDMDTSGTVNAGDIFQTIGNGQTVDFTVTLSGGNYTVSCNDIGHPPMLVALMVT